MKDDHPAAPIGGTESDVSDGADQAPEGDDASALNDIDPTADSDIAQNLDGQEPGYTFPGPGA